ncbi:MAG: 16S rRNA (adenine(1518)-N(6)/adenine(1519)-N(6))-dimethyltransferase RsmA [Bacillota bacterium]|nr:16S rRNA (adenine(1518)-N(6)/adenine(1519)-N(6))-dimethyltransferase RsmA [Bacillota bacterium]
MQNKITSPAYLKKILKENNLAPHRSMGQNFLVDENILGKIVDAARLDENDLVMDIGAGPGALSLNLASKVDGVIAVEWDAGLAGLLVKQAGEMELHNLHVIEGDVRRLDLEKICAEHWGDRIYNGKGAGKRIKVVANLPYYLTTPLLFKLLQGELEIELLVLMVQLEAAGRIMAAPGNKIYGTLSVLCQYYTKPNLLFKVKPNAFYPAPEVDSAVVLLEVLPEHSFNVTDEDIFWQIVRASFQKRRKTILNALEGVGQLEKGDWKKLLTETGIAPVRRGETLSLKEFANLSNLFYNKYGFLRLMSPNGGN